MVNYALTFKKVFKNIFFLFIGSLSVFGFSPFNLYLMPIISLLAFFLILNKINNASYSPYISFGLGFFLSGLYWIFISLNVFGQMPPFLAALSTLFFCIFLSLFFISLYSFHYKYSLLILPAIFTIAEWIRSFIFTGFPWLSYGYSQVYNSPLSGYFSVLGVHGVTFLLLFTVITCYKIIITKKHKLRILLLLIIISIWLGGHILKKIKWSVPEGEPLSISLIQGNIEQDKKWDRALVSESLHKYLTMIEDSSASLIILPETSVPVLNHNLPDLFKRKLMIHAKKNNGNIIYGVIEKDNGKYFNSAISIGEYEEKKYQKYHLVPFGEFIPFKNILNYVYKNWLNIPFNSLSRGDKYQENITIKDNQIAINICYEDVFGNEIIKSLPEANILVNLSNDAWYGESIASQQHLQISQARAIETGRMMIRATNTGATAVISPTGEIIDQIPLFEEGVLNSYAQGYRGITPYIKYGNFPIIIFSFFILISWILKRKISKN